MNLDVLHRKLVQAAKSQSPSSEVPYRFEQRILARLREHKPSIDPWLSWATGLWRASLPCLALLALVATWTWQHPSLPSSEGSAMVSDELEVAAVDTVDLSGVQEESW